MMSIMVILTAQVDCMPENRIWMFSHSQITIVSQVLDLPQCDWLICLPEIWVMRILVAHRDGPVLDPKRERERERDSLRPFSQAYEEGIVFMSEPSASRQ